MEKKYTVERNSAIELYRILLMFGICWLHCVCQGQWSGAWPRDLLRFCVPGFVFISGWFGIKFSPSKVLRLYSVPIYASLIAPICGGVLWTGGGYWREVLRVWNADGGFWFIHAYVILMAFAPVLNSAFEKLKGVCLFQVVMPILLVVMVWGVLLNYNHLKMFVPSSCGLKSSSFITFIGVYCVGRLCRLGKIDERIQPHFAVCAAIIIAIVISLSGGFLCHENNPVSLALAVFLFLAVKQIPLPCWMSAFVLRLSPLMFAVYCISGTVYFPFTKPIFFSVIEYLKDELFGCGFSPLLATFTTALIVFVLGMILALPQFAVALLHKDKLKRFYSFIDNGFEYIVLKISRVIG